MYCNIAYCLRLHGLQFLKIWPELNLAALTASNQVGTRAGLLNFHNHWFPTI